MISLVHTLLILLPVFFDPGYEKESRDTTEQSVVLSVSTNIPYDITYIPGYGLTSIPSFSLEYSPKQGHFTFGADVEWPMWQHWDRHDFFQINNITLWTRRYFRESELSYKGLYLFGSLNVARYGIGWNDRGWQGEGLGGTLGVGFKQYLGDSRFYFDFGFGAGVFWSRYDPYVYGNDGTGWYYYDYVGKPEDFRERAHTLTWFGPTRVHISIGFDIARRKKK